VAGHDNIKTTMRYVHPREHAAQKLFMRLCDLERPEVGAECKKSVQNPVQWEMPSEADIVKSLSMCSLQVAEVVELADTPSVIVALLVVYKSLILNLISFTSITSANRPRNDP
jgi:hypothetical protein